MSAATAEVLGPDDESDVGANLSDGSFTVAITQRFLVMKIFIHQVSK